MLFLVVCTNGTSLLLKGLKRQHSSHFCQKLLPLLGIFRQFMSSDWCIFEPKNKKMAVEGTKKNLGTSLLIVSAVLAPALATLPDARPPYVTRTFHSTAVDDYISEVRNV
jgi:hypothetical protein